MNEGKTVVRLYRECGCREKVYSEEEGQNKEKKTGKEESMAIACLDIFVKEGFLPRYCSQKERRAHGYCASLCVSRNMPR